MSLIVPQRTMSVPGTSVSVLGVYLLIENSSTRKHSIKLQYEKWA